MTEKEAAELRAGLDAANERIAQLEANQAVLLHWISTLATQDKLLLTIWYVDDDRGDLDRAVGAVDNYISANEVQIADMLRRIQDNAAEST